MKQLQSLFGEREEEFDQSVDKLKSIFKSFHPLYPSYAVFLNKVRDEFDKDFVKQFRDLLEKFYYAQEVVEVFHPPPLQDALKRKKGYYPKLIAFYPFEKFYSDTGKITIYPTTLKEARKRDVVPPVVEKETGETKEYMENITKNGEVRFPKELRFVYSTGKFKKGKKPSDRMTDDLKRRRAEYVLDHQEVFSTLLVNNAKRLLNK